LEEQVFLTEKKQAAGAQFFQTQAIFNPARLKDFMSLATSLNLKVLAGIIPLRDIEMAEFMHNQVPEITIPKEIVSRMRDAGRGLDETERVEAERNEGIQIALELLGRIRKIKGVNGVHLMGVGWTESIVELSRLGKLIPRPK
jgi:5,10-methylenetetrahydrofolate reductase